MQVRRGATIVFAGVVAAGSWAAPARAVVEGPRTEAPAQPSSISSSVDLGRYAVNGTVRAAVADPSTGVTYLGGDFTQIGIRTGSVAVVDPPDVSNGALRAGSPEVMGVVSAVFPDDRAGDPGFFIVGYLTAINGQKVARHPVYRMHVSGGAWVLDTSWVVAGNCAPNSAHFPVSSSWIATPTSIIAGGSAGPNGSTTGLTVIDRTTGRLWNLGGSSCSDNLLPSIPQLPALVGCAAMTHCSASVGRLAWEPTSHRVLVSYSYAVGNDPPAQWSEVAAYDLTAGSGGRSWLLPLQAERGPEAVVRAFPRVFGTLPGALLVYGSFPLDAGSTEVDASTLLLVDAVTGAIRQRWNTSGEQDPSNGSVIGPASMCATGLPVLPSVPARVDDEAVTWMKPWSGAVREYAPCRYRLAGGLLDAGPIGTVELPWAPHSTLPSTPYTGSDGTTYLLGSASALDLTHATLEQWDPDPAMNAVAEAPAVAVVDGNVVIGGGFNFVRGAPAPRIVALDGALAPVAGFASHLTPPALSGAVLALALSQGRLLAGGEGLTESGDPLVALDAMTGSVTWTAATPRPTIVDTISVGPAGDFWIGG
ncbi:MAG: hypothetical protein ACYC65_08625 [Candidatus Limnocylindrales bacterium]